MEEQRSKQILFIKRERVRRNLIRTKPGETICLQFEEVDLLLKWIKELEEKAKLQDERRSKYGFPKI